MEDELRTFVSARTFRLDSAAVKLKESLDQRETESETAILPRVGAICLPELVENVRQKFGAHAGAVVADRDLSTHAG